MANSNFVTRAVKVASILRRAATIKGFTEMKTGKPFNAEAYRDTREQWSYERGRVLGIVFAGQIKRGRDVTREAITAYAIAKRDGTII